MSRKKPLLPGMGTDPGPDPGDRTAPRGGHSPLGPGPDPWVPDPEGLPLPPEVDPWALEVSDLKQYAYCPRVVYYRYRLPDFRPQTYKMEAGEQAHRQILARWRRRLPRGLPKGEVRWEVPLYAPSLHLVGRVDVLLLTDDEAVVVDVKHSRKVRASWKDQLAAYGLLVETVFERPVRRGFLYLIPVRRLEEVPLSAQRKQRVRQRAAQIIAEIRAERQPPPTPRRGRCVDCEYRRFCNDLF